MMTEPRPPELYPPPGEPVPCAWCSGPIVNTPIGWMHLDQYRALEGWLCPEPHMSVAAPQIEKRAEGRASVPPPPASPSPRPRPTPIPPRKDPQEAPQEWPPSSNTQWWENRQ